MQSSRTLARIAAFTLAALACAPIAAAQTTLFSDDFEGGLVNWTPTNLWHRQAETGGCASNTAPFPSPGHAAAFNNATIDPSYCTYFTNQPGTLTSVLPIAIPANAVNARLRYMTFEATECQGDPDCEYDHRTVRVSDDGGQTWDDLVDGATEHVWYERNASLGTYVGQDILIQFRFVPVDSLGADGEGWMIDDVRVEIDSPFTLYCTGKISSVGCIPAVDAIGDVSLSGADDLVISARLLRNNVTSKLIWSRAPNNQPWGGGTLCVMAPAARTQIASSHGTAAPATDCTGTYQYAFTHAYLASKSVLAGETLHVQCSTRDPGYAPPHNHSLSNALSFTVLP